MGYLAMLEEGDFKGKEQVIIEDLRPAAKKLAADLDELRDHGSIPKLRLDMLLKTTKPRLERRETTVPPHPRTTRTEGRSSRRRVIE